MTNDAPHVSEIYDALDDDPDGSGDVIGVLRTLTDRFTAGFLGAEEYDTALRAHLGIPGRGLPVR